MLTQSSAITFVRQQIDQTITAVEFAGFNLPQPDILGHCHVCVAVYRVNMVIIKSYDLKVKNLTGLENRNQKGMSRVKYQG